ncbi:tetratricopeptide repeat protein [Roseivirga sp.]|uniref:tetratricopeptide repeat protein n=1 Tax=Roseivirga sp. TaxID=1964215 RepID=UPI003B523933
MRLKALIILAMVALYSSATAQFSWPEDPEKRSEAQTLWTLFDDNYRQGNFEGAKPHLAKLLEKYPKLSTSLYINGIKVWDETYSNSKDEAVQNEAASMVMKLYDMRFENFDGQEKAVIDRKAIDAFKYYFRDAEKTQMLLDVFERAYELKGVDAFYPLGRYYMQLAVLAFARDNVEISKERILEIYEQCTQHIDHEIAQARAASKSTKRYEDIKEFIDEKLGDMGIIDCDFIVNKLVPEFEQNPNDAELANKIFVFAFDGGCTDADWFVKAAETHFANSPQYGVGYLLGVKYGAEKEYEKSKEYFLKAAELTEDNTDKGKALKQIASTERINGNYTEARKYALEAAEVDPTLKADMYELIGDMVMASTQCDQKQSQVDDRARYIAAYDYYAVAGNTLKMSQAKAQFPTISDIFTENKKEGDSMTVGCWINKTVKLQRRPDQ